MKAEQVDQALHQKFVTEGARLVFWHDPNGEFAEYVGAGLPDDIAEVRERLVISTRRYAKQQDTWFARERDVQWLPSARDAAELPTLVESVMMVLGQRNEQT